ncbi:MAG: DUF4411 family protein [Gammaproteobacteria bacterium]
MYLLDTGAFITPSNMWYGLDFCSGFWDWLVVENTRGLVISIQQVREEINKEDTDQQQALLQWVKGSGRVLFEQARYQSSDLGRVGTWVRQAQPYNEGAKNGWLADNADPSLVAEALARAESQIVIVSTEVTGNPKSAAAGSQKQVKIPDVCDGLDIPCIQPWEMLRREQPSFILKRG